MKGDAIVIEEHHVRAAQGVRAIVLPQIQQKRGRYVLTVAGESGSGKSETAAAIAELLSESDVASVIFQQDDYFVYPPKTNDRTRRANIEWVGPQEVRLDLLDQHLRAFREGASSVSKPLVDYAEDTVSEEDCQFGEAQVAIAEGTYTTLLDNADSHVFIDRDHLQTREHREKRRRDASELDEFIERVLGIEHAIISGHKTLAQIIVNPDYSVSSSS